MKSEQSPQIQRSINAFAVEEFRGSRGGWGRGVQCCELSGRNLSDLGKSGEFCVIGNWYLFLGEAFPLPQF